MKYLFDTDICIYILKNKYVEIAKKIELAGFGNVAVSSISIAELEYGIAKSAKPVESEARLCQFLTPFSIVDFDIGAAQLYGRIRRDLYRKGKPIAVMDMLIASIAVARNLTLVTNNRKEFERVEGLRIENWIKK